MTRTEFEEIRDIDELILLARDYDLDCLDGVYSYEEALDRIGEYAGDHIREYGFVDFKNSIDVIKYTDDFFYCDEYCDFAPLSDEDFSDYQEKIRDEMEYGELFDEDEDEDEDEEYPFVDTYEDSPELEEPESLDSSIIKDLFGRCCMDIKSIDQHLEENISTFYEDFF